MAVVMFQIPFFQTSNGLENHFSNIEQSRNCSSEKVRTSNGHRINFELITLSENKLYVKFMLLFSNLEMSSNKSDSGNCYQVSNELFVKSFS